MPLRALSPHLESGSPEQVNGLNCNVQFVQQPLCAHNKMPTLLLGYTALEVAAKAAGN